MMDSQYCLHGKRKCSSHKKSRKIVRTCAMFGPEMLNPGRLEAFGKGPTADCLWQAGVLSGWKSFALLRQSSSVNLSHQLRAQERCIKYQSTVRQHN
ncbi:hypothetical protein C0Q70_17662 [Pomacea canaliculata]|uniref:Uncharacterized protein n=1 Tax=Pomacea canaliculata TaxID=400727 RepID=A0A2T7NL15_POMCA|nr:hypothetical protein C0Q70_17662 [Pomacea canaliculata]